MRTESEILPLSARNGIKRSSFACFFLKKHMKGILVRSHGRTRVGAADALILTLRYMEIMGLYK